MVGPNSSMPTRNEMKVVKNPLANWIRLVAMIRVAIYAPIDTAFRSVGTAHVILPVSSHDRPDRH